MGNKKYFLALATYVGTVMGVGLFGLPYVGAQSGFFILTLYILVGGTLAIIINRMYASVATGTDGLHRLPGYASIYLGSWGKPVAFVVKSLAIYGALLGYLIIGGQFLANLFGGPTIIYTFIFFIAGAFLVWQGAKSVGPVEIIMLFIFFAIVFLLFIKGVGKIEVTNLQTVTGKNFFVPYGIVLFSMWGASIVPEIKDQLAGNLKRVSKVIVWGLIICAAVYIAFSALVIGISGSETTTDAISGLEGNFGQTILMIGYVLGIITTFTSFIALGMTVQKLFWYDYKIPKFYAWALANFIPLGLFIIGFQNFIEVVGITGAVMLGLDGILVTLVFLSMKRKQQSVRLPMYKAVGSIMIVLLSTGVILQIFYTIRGF